MTENTPSFRQKIVTFPLMSGEHDENILRAKIKVIAYLAEETELAKRGIYCLNAARQVESILARESMLDFNLLPASIDLAMDTLEMDIQELLNGNLVTQLKDQLGYSVVFDWLSMNISLDNLTNFEPVNPEQPLTDTNN